MEKDPRYKTVKVMIETGNVERFSQIFDLIPKSVVANDLGLHNSRMSRLISEVGSFSVSELVKIAHLVDTDSSMILKLALNEYQLKTKPKNKK